MIARRWLVAVVLLAATGGCTALKRFLVPPQEAPDIDRARRTRDSKADLLIEAGAFLGGEVTATTVAVREGSVVAVGRSAELSSWRGPLTESLRLLGTVLVPGFVDAHLPLDRLALLPDAVDLRQATTRAQVERLLQDAMHGMQRHPCVWGFGLSAKMAAELRMADLDRIAPDQPLWLEQAEGLGALLNGALLRRLPSELTEAVVAAGGRLDEALVQAVWPRVPSPDLARWMPLLLQSLLAHKQRGFTEVHVTGATLALRQALVRLEGDGRLPLRVVLFFDASLPEARDLLAGKALMATRFVRVAGVSARLDGSLRSRTAALTQPWPDGTPPARLRFDDAQLTGWLADADRHQLQLSLQASGDAAVAQVVRVLTSSTRAPNAAPVRLEGLDVVAPEHRAALRGRSLVCVVPALVPSEAAGLSADRGSWLYRRATLAEICPLQLGSFAATSPEPVAWLARLSRAGAEGLTPAMALRSLLPLHVRRDGPALQPGDRADAVLWSRLPTEAGRKPPLPQTVMVDGLPLQVNFEAP
jgi:predicted amidohydrolase YtcJ